MGCGLQAASSRTWRDRAQGTAALLEVDSRWAALLPTAQASSQQRWPGHLSQCQASALARAAQENERRNAIYFALPKFVFYAEVYF